MEGPIAEEKGLLCPECACALSRVYAEANYGRVILLDQCMRCGGVWFDRWELYFVKESSLKSLEAVDVEALLAPVPRSRDVIGCPSCGLGMALFNDPVLPRDVSIMRCAACRGLWLNRGDIGRYARHKEGLRGAGTRVSPADGALGLETLKHLQKELRTEGIAPARGGLAAVDDGPIEPKELAKDIGFLILQTLLRLFFKF